MISLISVIEPVNWVVMAGTDLFLLLVIGSSILERERRAAWIAAAMLLGNTVMWGGFIWQGSYPPVVLINLLAWGGLIFFGAVTIIKYFPPYREMDVSGIQQFDERDHMFSRNNIKRFPELAKRYYSEHPENRDGDAKMHALPDLGEPGHTYYDPQVSPMFEAAFGYLHGIRKAGIGEPGVDKVAGENIRDLIISLGKYHGAVDVGITRLKPYHLYTHYGRQEENYGAKIHNDHSHAVVIVVAMSLDMMKHAPALPVILESSRQYVESAKIAHIVSHYIRELGYEARAHTDGFYETLCVPMAVDAGLGELGRMGLLMHPEYGPCIRLSVVTTNLPLDPTSKKDHHIREFCDICKKCSDNCPTQSINGGEPEETRGFAHWSVKQETCYAFWKRIGTDCGFCIRVCPYSKPNTLFHKLIRWYISRNPINQRIALFMDDLFYGRKIKIPTRNPEDNFSGRNS